MITDLRDKIADLFKLMDDDFTWPPQLGVKGVAGLISRVYRTADDPTPPPEAGEKPTTTHGTRSPSSAKPRNSAAKKGSGRSKAAAKPAPSHS